MKDTLPLGKACRLSRENNINLIRLVAAASVTFAHSFALLGQKPAWNWLIPCGEIGQVAVSVFFGLSGFLITQSFERRKSSIQFLSARWLRIFPGLFFACLTTTILVSQFVKYQGWSAIRDLNNWRYTFGAFFFDLPYFGGVFDGLPSNGVNGSLWTLPIEFHMYIFVFIFGLAGITKRRRWFLIFTALLLVAGIFHIDFVVTDVFHALFKIDNFDSAHLSLPLCFIVGMLFYLYREQIPLNFWLAVLILLMNFALSHWMLAALSFVYASFTFGFHPRLYIPSLNFRTDISYGIYILSYPIQQTLIFNNITFEPHLFFLFVMILVVPLALVCWQFVESPALRLKNKFGAVAKPQSIEKMPELNN